MPKELGKLAEKDDGSAGGEKPEYGGVHIGDSLGLGTGTYEPLNQAAAEEVMDNIRKYGGK